MAPPPACHPSALDRPRVLAFCSRHWFLLSLAGCLALGFGPAGWLQPLAASTGIRATIVGVVMFLMAVTLKSDAIVRSIRAPGPSLLAISLNIALVPSLAAAVAWLLPPALGDGLIVAALVPCTLASASVWTRRAGGDDAISLMTTIVTNLFCFAVAPLGLAILLRRSAELDYFAQVQKLFLVVGVPIVLAQLFRRLGGSDWVDYRKGGVSLMAQLGLLLMVLLGAVETDRRMAAGTTALGGWGALLAMLGLATLVHLTALGAAIVAARSAGLTRAQQIAVGIAGSQKTLMVGLEIAIGFGASVLPMIAFHVSQLIVDTVVVDRWRRADQADQPPRDVPNAQDVPDDQAKKPKPSRPT